MFKNRCYNGGNKHKFEARYDEKDAGNDIEGKATVKEIRSLQFYNIYVKDVCVWCGKEIKREK